MWHFAGRDGVFARSVFRNQRLFIGFLVISYFFVPATGVRGREGAGRFRQVACEMGQCGECRGQAWCIDISSIFLRISTHSRRFGISFRVFRMVRQQLDQSPMPSLSLIPSSFLQTS